MLRLLRYLKPYLLPLWLAAGLLFAQANADLALPDYLSRIVNTGIQQGGVDGVASLLAEEAPGARMDRVPMLRGRITAVAGVPAEQDATGDEPQGRTWDEKDIAGLLNDLSHFDQKKEP